VAITVPPELEAAIADSLGVTSYDAGSLQITLVNLADAGVNTTVRFTTVYSLPLKRSCLCIRSIWGTGRDPRRP